MFATIIQTFDRYSAKYGGDPGYNPHLAAEVKVRLEELQFIIERVREVETSGEATAIKSTQAAALKSPGEAFEVFTRLVGEMSVEAKVLTEAFYHCAWRIHLVINDKSAPLPGLSFEAKKIRGVRNQLMVHPKKGDFAQSFGTGGPRGPILKQGRPASSFQDEGLYVNAEEFATKLSGAFEKALAVKP
jgi:hypothetical protein